MIANCRRWFVVVLFCLVAMHAHAGGDGADALRQRYDAASAALANNDFGRPLVLESSDADHRVRGEVLARLDQPLPALRAALEDPQRWCEIMLLTPSITQCVAQAGTPAQLRVRLGRRFDQAPEDGVKAQFSFHPKPSSNDRYSAVQLDADKGPMGTSDYRIEVEALALDDQRSVLRMAYSYRYGLKASLATKLYLATKGGDKVGFTHVDDPGVEDALIGGMRGSVERNAMRYYLAIEAHVAESKESDTPSQRLKASLDRWLEAIAKYPRQIAESDPEAYRRVKRERFAATASQKKLSGNRMKVRIPPLCRQSARTTRMPTVL
jgi:hypothetical protein